MGLITRPYSYTAGNTILSAQVNGDFNTIYSEFNGSISTANLASNANLADTQLAQITTAGKVSILALGVASQATGDLIYASSSSVWARLAVGTSSQVLIGGTIPAWGGLPLAAMPSGTIVQVVNSQTGAVSTGTTVIPNDDSIPQITEGDQYMTLAITPKASANTLVILINANLSTDVTTSRMVGALFQDATAGALAASATSTSSQFFPQNLTLIHNMTAGTTSATTFRFRAGATAAGTTTFNGTNTGRSFGGVIASSITIVEMKA